MSIFLDRVAEVFHDLAALMKFIFLTTVFVTAIFAVILTILNYWIPH